MGKPNTAFRRKLEDRNRRLWVFYLKHRHHYSIADVARVFKISPQLALYWIHRMDREGNGANPQE